MSFSNNNNYQSYGNFINSQNVYSSQIINNITMNNSFKINNNNSNINNNIIISRKQIQYGAVNNNQVNRVQQLSNIIPIMQRNQRSISPQLNLFRRNVMPSPQNKISPQYYIRNGIIYKNNQRIYPNSLQKIPTQNNINSKNDLIAGNVQRNFIPNQITEKTQNFNINNNTIYNQLIINSLINTPYRALPLQSKIYNI